jgi:hypothetical protein
MDDLRNFIKDLIGAWFILYVGAAFINWQIDPNVWDALYRGAIFGLALFYAGTAFAMRKAVS